MADSEETKNTESSEDREVVGGTSILKTLAKLLSKTQEILIPKDTRTTKNLFIMSLKIPVTAGEYGYPSTSCSSTLFPLSFR